MTKNYEHESNDVLLSEFLAFFETRNDEIASVLISRSQNNHEFLPFCQLYRMHVNQSQSVKVGINDALLKKSEFQNLKEDIWRVADDIGIRENDKLNFLLRISALSLKFCKRNTLSEINKDEWAIIKHNFTQYDVSGGIQWRKEIAHQDQIRLRALGRLMSNIKQDDFYEFSIDKGRRSKMYALEALRYAIPIYNEWFDKFDEYINTLSIKSLKPYRTAAKVFIEYLNHHQIMCDIPTYFMMDKKPDLWSYLKDDASQKSYKSAIYHARILNDFSIWFIENELSEEDDGHIISLACPFFSDMRLDMIKKSGESAKINRASETERLVIPNEYIELIKEILTENDYRFPKSLSIENHKIQEYRGGPTNKIWCPANTMMILLMLELPIRRIQAALLDSGEGDEKFYSLKQKKWVDNEHECAGIWTARNAKRTVRGTVQPDPSNFSGDHSVIYVNTNKTADRGKEYDETSGYVIPWHNENVIEIVDFMRNWQEKHNPVSAPLSGMGVKNGVFNSAPSEKVKKSTPHRFYLFRTPYNGDPESPPTYHQTARFWDHIMEELQRRLNAAGDDIEIIKKYDANGYPCNPIFNLHGLRVTGLTSFYKAGVPIEILSKLVAGHASILMTLHYIKLNPSYITNVLNGAQKKIEDQSQFEFKEWLQSRSWDEASRFAVFNNKDVYQGDIDPTLAIQELGICPTAGSTCSTGGEMVRKSIVKGVDKSVYGPVDESEGKCLTCRYFITGSPWLIPLWLFCNKLFKLASDKGKLLTPLREQTNELVRERRKLREENPSDPKIKEITDLLGRIKNQEAQISSVTDGLLNKAHRAYNLIEKIKLLIENDGDFSTTSDKSIIVKDTDFQGEEFGETSELRQLDLLVKSGRHYPIVNDDYCSVQRDRFIDQICFNSGKNPISLLPLTDKQKQVATDAATDYLLSKYTDYEINELTNNRLTLKDFNDAGFIEVTEKAIQAIEHDGVRLSNG